MKAEFEVTINDKNLFAFNMYQTYFGTMSGGLSILLFIVLGVIGGMTVKSGNQGNGMLYIGVAVFILVYNPVSLRMKAMTAMKANPVMRIPLCYAIDEENISVTQGEASAALPWESVYKIIGTGRQVLIYSNRVNAYVIPREQIGEKYDVVKAIAEKKLPAFRRKMK